MRLLREYLRFFNSGSAWTVYAARNQNLTLSPSSGIVDLSGNRDSQRPHSKAECDSHPTLSRTGVGGRTHHLSLVSPVEETHYNSPRQEGVQARHQGQSLLP